MRRELKWYDVTNTQTTYIVPTLLFVRVCACVRACVRAFIFEVYLKENDDAYVLSLQSSHQIFMKPHQSFIIRYTQ